MIFKLDPTVNHFGFIKLVGDWHITTDPVGFALSYTEKLQMKITHKQRYEMDLWTNWDGFYRCKLRIPYKIHKFMEGRYK